MTQQPIAFSGEFDVEDDAFECIVDRFIYKGTDVSFEFSCFDSEGGAHKATGAAQQDSLGRFVTSEFRVRYATDRTDTPARFRIESVDYDAAAPTLAVAATWEQAGETFALLGKLSRFRP
jgi:hypothetical protein